MFYPAGKESKKDPPRSHFKYAFNVTGLARQWKLISLQPKPFNYIPRGLSRGGIGHYSQASLPPFPPSPSPLPPSPRPPSPHPSPTGKTVFVRMLELLEKPDSLTTVTITLYFIYYTNLMIYIMEICKAPTRRPKVLSKHSITHVRYIEMENVRVQA